MKRIFLTIIIIFSCATYVLAQENNTFFSKWEEGGTGIYESALVSVIVTLAGNVLASSEKAVYMSIGTDNNFNRICFLPKTSTVINDTSYMAGDIYISTTDGLYKINGQETEAKRIFKSWTSRKHINCIKLNNKNLYLGTMSGLYISDDDAKSWSSVDYFKNKQISDIAFLDKDIFVTTEDGIYKGEELSGNWLRVFVAIADEIETQDNENYEDDASEEIISCLLVKIHNGSLYAGTSNGLFISEDKGGTWQRITSNGLISNYIEDILILDKYIIAATKKGIFLKDKTNTGWRPLSNNPISHHTKRLAFNKKNEHIYAATTNGLYRCALKNKEHSKMNNDSRCVEVVKKQLQTGPSIRQVQQAAIKYAEVDPGKIKGMRKAAANKAWLPKLALGFDYDNDVNVNVDRGSTSDADVFILGPEEEGWGWDVALSWDLGNLVWNDDQTSIDVRSKLMVQLRDDVLTQVTNLYFERKKLQLNIIKGKYQGAGLESIMLRLDELTARIDALTDGLLSTG